MGAYETEKCFIKRNIGGNNWLTILLLAGGAGAKTLTVDDSFGADVTKIQVSIDYARAGDTILVYSGIYRENVIVNKPLILKGINNGGGKPVVKAATRERPDELSITLISDGVTIDGFRTEGGSAGIGLFSENNIIINNTAADNNVGIFLNGSSKNILNNNIALNNTYGIFLQNSSNNNIINGNVASGNDYGIIVYSNNNTLSGNNISNNILAGIYLAGTGNNTIYNNFFNNNKNFDSGINFNNFENNWNVTKTPGFNIVGGSYIGGNFWTNPIDKGFSQTCVDSNIDGICDSPYTVQISATDNIDYLPLAYIPSSTKMTLTVDDSGGADYTRIQDAINNAKAGATLLVYSGTYNENVIVNKPLILKGIDNGWGKPIINSSEVGYSAIIQGESPYSIALRVGNITLDGFKTMGYYSGISVESNNNKITNVTVLEKNSGIRLINSTNIIMENNKAFSGIIPLEYKPFTAKLVNLALIILTLCTMIMLYIKRENLWSEISGRAVNASKGAIKYLTIGAIKGIFIGFIASGVISMSMLNLGFFAKADDPAWVYGISLLIGAFIGTIVGAIAGLIRDAAISAIAGAILGVALIIGRVSIEVTTIGEYIGLVILGALVGSVIGRAVFNIWGKGSMNGAIIGGVIGFGGLFKNFSMGLIGSIIIGVIFGSFIGGVLELLAGRVSENKEAVPKGAIAGLIASAIAGAITGVLYPGEALYISLIVGLVVGAIIGGIISLYLGASKHFILCAFIGGIIVGSVTGLITGGAIVDGILITKQRISEDVLLYGSVGAIVGMIVGLVQTRKNAILVCAIGGSISALIAGGIGYFAVGGHTVNISLILIPITGAIVGGIISIYYGTRKYTILRVILGGMITGIIVGVVGGLMRF